MKIIPEFSYAEAICAEGGHLIATYFLKLPFNKDILKKAASFAVGQTLGTWVPIPGITEEMKKKHMAKVIGVLEAPPCELSGSEPEQLSYFLQIAFPVANFNNDLPMLITALLGNDASTSTQAKLVDISFPTSFLAAMGGPAYGIEGIRRLTGVHGRPLLLSMVKPCTGISPKTGAEIMFEAACGGVDIIKDDELLGNTSFSSVEQRVICYRAAAKRAFEETGNRCIYAVNVTGTRLADNIKAAEQAGAEMLMINFAASGIQSLQIAKSVTDLPILGHYAGAGMYFESPLSGISSQLICAKLPRISGADMVIINTPYGGYPLRRDKYLLSAHALTSELPGISPSMPIAGGGVHAGMSELLISELGKDIILASGGAIYGHPQGARAGARAMRASIEAVVAGVPVDEAAKECQALGEALEKWGRM